MKNVILFAAAVIILALIIEIPAAANSEDNEDIENLIKKAFEDNSWLELEESEVKHYLLKIFTEKKAEKLQKELQNFLSANYDWHSMTKVNSIKKRYEGKKYIICRVTLEIYDLNFCTSTNSVQYSLSEAKKLKVKIKKTTEGLKIDEFHYLN